MNFSVLGATYCLNGLRDAIDSGGLAGYAQFYDGARPATGAAGAGALVVTAPFALPCGTVDGAGALIIAPGTNGLVLVASPPTWVRVRNSAGAFVADFNARLIGDPPTTPDEIVLNAASLTVGAYVAIVGGPITVPM